MELYSGSDAPKWEEGDSNKYLQPSPGKSQTLFTRGENFDGEDRFECQEIDRTLSEKTYTGELNDGTTPQVCKYASFE